MRRPNMLNALRFGIESLDSLIGSYKDASGREAFGIKIAEDENESAEAISYLTTSICLIGPDGTGKSVLAQHLAAQYMADCYAMSSRKLPKVLYISTDLTHSMANRMWSNFDLRHPLKRKDPFATKKKRLTTQGLDADALLLAEKSPKAMNEVLASQDNKYEVCFVDLSQTTAGDDWGFVHRMLAVLDQPKDNEPKHLVLLDAVEGFETLVGELNAFGEKSTRRSRIAQVMRLAANKCHLLFVVEEVKQERLPEEFVTDTVIRLRNIVINDYVRRTVEIEKTRGQTHVRGQHPFVTRNGEGSTTGDKSYENFDDRRVLKAESTSETQSYVQVFPSINYLSRRSMEVRGKSRMDPPKDRYVGFGIPYLDSMLAGEGETHTKANLDIRGLPCSSVTALIGDALTQKGQLGRAFLSRAFYPFASELALKFRRECPKPEGKYDEQTETYKAKVREFENKVKAEIGTLDEITLQKIMASGAEDPAPLTATHGKVPGVALMITTQDTHSVDLAKEFIHWLNPKSLLGIRDEIGKESISCFERILFEYVKAHTICRRMEIHDLSSPVLAHIFQRNVEAAQRNLFALSEDETLPDDDNRYRSSWRIRLVIDDFNAFRTTFPDFHNDPLLLPFLIFHLGREGVSTLILDTQSGRPDIALSERFESSLREQADHRLYTWRIPFYGENRIAITAIPPLSLKNRGIIRELGRQWMSSGEMADDDGSVRRLTVDPHFELYTGLESGQPHPVPLEVRLYPGTKTLIKYIEDENVFFKELFVPKEGKHDIIVGFDPPTYESFREFCYLQRDTRLDHTLVFQVDEFWLTWLNRQSKTRKAGVLQHQWPYLDTTTVNKNGEPERAADAYYLFQETFSNSVKRKNDGSARILERWERRRRDFYDDERLGYGYMVEGMRRKPNYEDMDRVPFMWDFAFLLCRENLWNEYINADHLKDKQEQRKRVKQVWEDIPQAKAELHDGESCLRPYKKVSWRCFLEACKEVAEYHSAKTSTAIPAFDFSMNDGEAFSCLMLEIWSSEIYESMQRMDEGRRAKKQSLDRKFALRLSEKKWEKSKVTKKLSLLEGLLADAQSDVTRTLREDLEAQKNKEEKVGYALDLYKSWLLLTEVINFDDLINTPDKFSFEFQSRQPSPHAVAAHHWYQSACDLIDQHQLAENLVAVRLPGHFSVRGDWFLASAGGSRSNRLAQRAMDLLNSRRANIKRLQLGIGLPVRKIADYEDFKNVRTRLIATDSATGRLKNVSYQEFLSIAGRTNSGKSDPRRNEEFYWLWRSSIYGYARYSKVWQKWLNRMALWWHTIHTRYRSAWTPGFAVYDKINRYLDGDPTVDPEEFSQYESWSCFHDMVHILLTELKHVSFGNN